MESRQSGHDILEQLEARTPAFDGPPARSTKRNPLWEGEGTARVYPLQYAQLEWRYKFLVLVGPSRTAKKQLARSLAGPTGGLPYKANCASGSEPDLRGFRFSRHGLVLIDEVHPAQVAAQRFRLQAGAA